MIGRKSYGSLRSGCGGVQSGRGVLSGTSGLARRYPKPLFHSTPVRERGSRGCHAGETTTMTDSGNKRCRRLSLRWVLLSVLVVAALVLALAPSVPRYEGKTVYDWMFETGLGDQPGSSLAHNKGLSAIGSNAVPYLARALAK